MNVRDCMSGNVRTVSPQTTLQAVARLMKEIDAGAAPVGENDQLVGMITDRDIAIRAVAEGKGVDTTVGEVMTPDIEYVFDDEDIEDASIKMGRLKVRRLPVLNRDKRLVGMLSIGDLAKSPDPLQGQAALAETAEPGGPHRQV